MRHLGPCCSRLASRTTAILLATLLGTIAVFGARDALAAPATALVMPFDATAGSVSFLHASHPGTSSAGVRTHWTFWDESCTPLADAIVCLPADGSVIVDPTVVPATSGPADLSGRRGFATVTAYVAPDGCDPADDARGALARDALLGSFTLADVAGGVSVGGPALALPADPSGTFVDLGAAAGAGSEVRQSALRLQSFDPADLDVSRVILLALREQAGSGAFRAAEPGPAVDGDTRVRADVRYADRDGASVALGDGSLGCVTFASLRRDDPATLLPIGGPADAIASSGFLELARPRIGDQPLGRTTWLAGFHAQGVGTFGVLAVGDATLASGPTTSPTPATSATPRPSAKPTPTARPGATPTPRPTGGSTTTPTPLPSTTPARTPTPRPSITPGGSTATPVATASPSPVPGVTPSPAPTVGTSPTPGTGTPTPRPTSTTRPSPSPSASPRPIVTPTAAATATATPVVTATPPATPTSTSGSCGALTVEVRTAYGSGVSGDVSGVIATVSYPASVAIPGTGGDTAVTARVSNVSGVGGLFQATDGETQLRAGLVSIATSIPAGPFVRITFDCVGGSAPPASAFGCTLEASTLGGTLLPGASCITEIVS